jgi:alcohol oxidase
MKFYRGDLQIEHPNFAEGSQAATQKADTPVEISVSEIVYSKEDDNAIDEYHRRKGSYPLVQVFRAALIPFGLVTSTWHSVRQKKRLTFIR